VPWSKLTYDTNLGGYRTDLTEQQLGGRQLFRATESMTGATVIASASCTTTTGRPTTGDQPLTMRGEIASELRPAKREPRPKGKFVGFGWEDGEMNPAGRVRCNMRP
jgi:hypothetical protein